MSDSQANSPTNPRCLAANKLNISSGGQLFVISAPSGTGKTTLVQQLLSLGSVAVSVSYTTRSPRPREQDHVEYHFVDVPTFEQMILRGEFLEYANVFGNYYGTSRQVVESLLAQRLDVILEIDYQGALQVLEKFPAAVAIYIVPPSPMAQRERLKKRAQDADEVIERRLSEAAKEVVHYRHFDYLVVNDTFEHAANDIKAVLTSYRLQRSRQEVVHRYVLDSFQK